MSELKKEMVRVHENTDFKVNFAGTTELGEFKYTHGGSVQPGLEYHIHYTNDKEEVFMTGGVHNNSSKIIQKVGGNQSLFSTYSDLNSQTKGEYPQKFSPIPTESDYKFGKLDRIFAQKANDLNGELFEIKPKDRDINSLFRYISISWRISGKKSEVIRNNQRTIDSITRTRGNEQLRKILFPLQYWNPPKGSVDDIQRKLGRLKNTLVIPPPEPQSTIPNENYLGGDDRVVINPNTGLPVRIDDLTNIVYDDDGNAVIGFADGTRVDLTESGP